MDWIAPLLALTLMEIVLGIDNVVFIAVLSGRLPKHQQAMGRYVGLGLAMVVRIILLLTLKYVIDHLEFSLFQWTSLGVPAEWLNPGDAAAASEAAHEAAESGGHGDHAMTFESLNRVTLKDAVMFLGGLFLLWKSVVEIHKKIEGVEHGHGTAGTATLAGVLVQIAMIDLVFSIDSVITAIGMAQDQWIMVVAIVISIGFMLAFSGPISSFIEKHPTVKMLALSFLLLIGVMLVAEGFGTHINKGYIYFAMAFSLLVEVLNLRMKLKRNTRLRPGHAPGDIQRTTSS